MAVSLLSAKSGLFTAVVLCLLTDKRMPARSLILPAPNRAAMWGEGVDIRVDLGETDLVKLLQRALQPYAP